MKHDGRVCFFSSSVSLVVDLKVICVLISVVSALNNLADNPWVSLGVGFDLEGQMAPYQVW